ncbi:hypothetical protein Q8A67_008235 [Cirrhinus molitorella]|uniref:Uncharacterized protein n=1 Tax=Cirrhinus molitorella TaxID=172907 RepID=A0AA88U122_9TELE|nr:hypothetical protein Q8A67_008235 [Cirrhinus molitorella]
MFGDNAVVRSSPALANEHTNSSVRDTPDWVFWHMIFSNCAKLIMPEKRWRSAAFWSFSPNCIILVKQGR